MPFHLYLLGVCFFISLYFIKRSSLIDKCTPLFLLVLFTVEYYCHLLKLNHKGNNFQYNIWFPFEFSFYVLVINSSINNKKNKKIIYLLLLTYFIFITINYIFFQNLNKFSGSSYLMSVILLLLTSFIKMKELVITSVMLIV